MNRHQFQQAAKMFRAGKIPLEQFTEQAFDVIVGKQPATKSAAPKKANSALEPVANPGAQLASNPNMQTSKPANLNLDLARQMRCGFPEVIFGIGKKNETLSAAVGQLASHGQNVLATRLNSSQMDFLETTFENAHINRDAGTFRLAIKPIEPSKHKVAVVTAGTADMPVALESIETLKWMSVETVLICDVGVAGPERFPAQLERLADCAAVIVIAGMEASLATYAAAHLSCPVICVPTSVGYGLSMDGVTALLAMLNACTANVTVVNIDAGFKAAFVGGLIARQNIDNPTSVQLRQRKYD